MNAPILPTLSIIIPTLNEAAGIERLLRALAHARTNGTELIVVDGGSEDETLAIAEPLADQVLRAPRGRAIQMNAGATLARSEVLVFLHADSTLPENADILVREEVSRTKKNWGRFDIKIDSSHPLLRLVAIMINLRTRLTGIATGDQAIFVMRTTFQSINGYPEIPLMEDIALSKTLRAKSRPISIAQKVTTSARRWEARGILRTVFLMWRLRLAYFMGSDPQDLLRLYEGKAFGS